MDKVKMQSMDITADNIEKIGALFPEAVTEVKKDGKVTKAIDFDVLKNLLIAGNTEIAEGRKERYEFNWPEKKKHARLANQPTTSTLRPVREDSVDFDTTENLYIEGDNLEVLKLLQNGYAGRIKMIYIDPPYNTGNDFVYNDDFKAIEQNFKEANSYYDEDGNVIADANTTSNGRFHTDWLNMMYPRLKLAKNLLSDDGVIFISIGQNENANLSNVCNEIFSEANKIAQISRVMKSGSAKGQFFSPNVEYIFVYAKNILNLTGFRQPLSEEIINKLYTSIESSGIRKGEKYRPFGLYQASLDARPNQRYYIEAPDGELLIPPGDTFPYEEKDGAMVSPNSNDKVWRWSKERYIEEKLKGNIEFKKSDGVLLNSRKESARWNVYTKLWLNERQEEGMVPVDLITKWENRISKKELKDINIPFDFAKPIELIKFIFSIIPENKDAIVLDFFSGSATTAHAVMQLNAEDNGHRKFIMVQLPEKTAEKSEAYKAGYKNICEIGKERIRRAGKKIKDENPLTTTDLDTGFRVLRLDSSNMKEVFYKPEEFDQENIALFADNVKADRTDEDLLFQTMLSHKIELSVKIEELTLAGKKAFSVDDGYLIACFDKDITIDTIEAIAKRKPVYAVVRDASFNGDSTAENFEQIFRQFSPDTVRKVI